MPKPILPGYLKSHRLRCGPVGDGNVGLIIARFVPCAYGTLVRGTGQRYSTVTDLARLRGWSTSLPRRTAMW